MFPFGSFSMEKTPLKASLKLSLIKYESNLSKLLRVSLFLSINSITMLKSTFWHKATMSLVSVILAEFIFKAIKISFAGILALIVFSMPIMLLMEEFLCSFSKLTQANLTIFILIGALIIASFLILTTAKKETAPKLETEMEKVQIDDSNVRAFVQSCVDTTAK